MAITDRELAELRHSRGTQKLDAFKGVKKLPLEEFKDVFRPTAPAQR